MTRSADNVQKGFHIRCYTPCDIIGAKSDSPVKGYAKCPKRSPLSKLNLKLVYSLKSCLLDELSYRICKYDDAHLVSDMNQNKLRHRAFNIRLKVMRKRSPN